MAKFEKKKDAGYNERLFSKGLRGKLHSGRFEWVNHTLRRAGVPSNSVLELGAFDGKVINWLPEKPKRYLGLDANWENGLEIAAARWKEHPEYEFRHCNAPERMFLAGEKFDVSLCMETLEHVPTNMVDPYLAELARATRHLSLISVPNEIGPVFAAKYLTKLAFGDAYPYSVSEMWYQTLGRVENVVRDQHKGFSYRRFQMQLERHFEIVRIEGIPFRALPPYLSFGIGFVVCPKRLTA